MPPLSALSKVQKAPAYSFSGRSNSSAMRSTAQSNPGPGSYEVRPQTDNGPNSGSFNSSICGNEFSSTFKKAPGYSWARKDRSSVHQNTHGHGSGGQSNNPGPGSYDVMSSGPNRTLESALNARPSSAKGFGSMAARNVGNSLNTNSRSQNPGPGSYDIESATTMCRGGNTGNYNNTFGIGSSKSQTGPSFSMGSKRKIQTGSGSVPGPGAYSSSSDYSGKSRHGVSMSKSVAPQFSKSKRDPGALSFGQASSQTPGPGSYESNTQPHKQKAPQFSMGSGRREVKPTATPGPGAHEATYSLFE